uniref:Uncharacterized protein n=1 Tax=Romanomermis culicivorax TaxID=13658 RepID=A0A915IXN5_ROMCU
MNGLKFEESIRIPAGLSATVNSPKKASVKVGVHKRERLQHELFIPKVDTAVLDERFEDEIVICIFLSILDELIVCC